MSTQTVAAAKYCPIHKKPVKEHGSAFYCQAGHSVSRYKLLDADVLEAMAEEQEAEAPGRGRRIDPPDAEPEPATVKPHPPNVHGVLESQRFVSGSGTLIVRLLRTTKGRYRVNWRRESKEGEVSQAHIFDGTSHTEAATKYAETIERTQARGWRERSSAKLRFEDIPEAGPGEPPPSRHAGGRPRKAR